jgi:hypothetical protein
MKFKIEKGTGTYEKLMALKKRCLAAHAATNAVLDELGASQYIRPSGSISGGIVSVEFASKPEGWRKSDWGQGTFQPKVTNVEWVEKLKALPIVPASDLNKIVGFVPQRKGLTKHLRPALDWDAAPILLSVNDAVDYTPPNADIVEILGSEYRRLLEDKKRSKTSAT